MKTSTTKRKAIADAVELLKEESPNAPGNIAGVQLIPIEKVRKVYGGDASLSTFFVFDFYLNIFYIDISRKYDII